MAQKQKIKQYQDNQIPVEGNPASNEAWALLETARRMAAVIEFGDLKRKADKEKLRDAMRLNLRIWTVIQTEQLTGKNTLPGPIRENILNLCRFIDRHTIQSIPAPTAENIIVLIDLNRHIASGLLGISEDEDVSSKAGHKSKIASKKEATPVQVVI
mgnify:CR=1 FL=1|tara:strand:+ start:120 stop:590 length:471 start_codon:yes stop_codon:yes gene_type:complete